MDDERLKKAIELVTLATEKDRAGEYESALQFYKSSLEHWQLVCKYQKNPTLKTKLFEKMEPYVSRAEAIKKYLDEKKKIPVQSATSNGSQENLGESAGEGSSKLKETINQLLTQEKPKIKWDDVAGLDMAKTVLQEAVVLPSRFPELFIGKRQPWKAILLYGPPGTGKTHLARACAAETSATFLSVSSADLISKWQGESEKLVRALFQVARENQPAVIFVDEVDSLCGARNDRESESSKRIKTEFLVQMEGLNSTQGTRLLVLGATMLKIHIGDTPHDLSESDMKELAISSEGYSGADISVLVRNALLQPLRKCQSAKFFRKVNAEDSYYYMPADDDDPDSVKESLRLMDIPPNKLRPKTLSIVRRKSNELLFLRMQTDFRTALQSMKSAVASHELLRYEQWTKQFGFEGQ